MARPFVLASSTTPCHYAARLNSGVSAQKGLRCDSLFLFYFLQFRLHLMRTAAASTKMAVTTIVRLVTITAIGDLRLPQPRHQFQTTILLLGDLRRRTTSQQAAPSETALKHVRPAQHLLDAVSLVTVRIWTVTMTAQVVSLTGDDKCLRSNNSFKPTPLRGPAFCASF